MRTTTAAVVLIALVVGCSEPMLVADDGGADAAAPTSDAGPDPLAPIDPDAPPVEGEGDACELSVQCAPRQICVDDACVRHERVDAADLTWGEVRHRNLAELLDEAGDPFPRPWTSLLDGEQHSLRSWTLPSESGTALLFTVDAPADCPIFVAGARLRTAWISGLRCTALAPAPRDHVWAGGIDAVTQHPILVGLDADDSEIARHDLADLFDDAIGEAAPARVAGSITSVLAVGDEIYLSIRLADSVTRDIPLDQNELVFAQVGEGGVPELLSVGGRLVHVDSEAGWIIPSVAGSPAALVIGGDPANPDDPVPLDLLDLWTGESERLIDDWAIDIRYAVPEPGGLEMSVFGGALCELRLFSGGEETGYIPRYDACTSRRVRAFRPFDAHRLWNLPAIGHPVFGSVDLGLTTTDPRSGVVLELLDYMLHAARSEQWERPHDYPFSDPVPMSRHRLTFEGALGLFQQGEPFEWFELPMRRGEMR